MGQNIQPHFRFLTVRLNIGSAFSLQWYLFNIQVFIKLCFEALFPHDISFISLLAWTQNEILNIRPNATTPKKHFMMLFFLLSFCFFFTRVHFDGNVKYYIQIDSKKVSKQKKRQNFFRVTITNLHVQMSYHASVIRVTISW